MDELEIINRAKLNDEEAFEQLIEKYKPIIERFAYQIGVKDEDIAEIVQKTFIKIHRKLHQFVKGKFSTWLYQITLNITRDYYRKQKRESHLWNRAKEQQKQFHSSNYYFEKHEHVYLHECILQLDDKYKLPLILYYFHDRTYQEIAIILKIRLSTVKARIYRAKQKLKTLFEETINKEVYQNG